MADKQLSKQEPGRKCLSVDEWRKSDVKASYVIHSLLHPFPAKLPFTHSSLVLGKRLLFVSSMPEKSLSLIPSVSFFSFFTDYCFFMSLKALVLSFSSADLNSSNSVFFLFHLFIDSAFFERHRLSWYFLVWLEDISLRNPILSNSFISSWCEEDRHEEDRHEEGKDVSLLEAISVFYWKRIFISLSPDIVLYICVQFPFRNVMTGQITCPLFLHIMFLSFRLSWKMVLRNQVFFSSFSKLDRQQVHVLCLFFWCHRHPQASSCYL